MKTKQKRFSAVIAMALALSILMVSASAVISAEEASLLAVPKVPQTVSVHKNIDITEITGEVVEPPMLTSAASSVAKEKEWYEYVYYSPEPVAYYYLNETSRIAFYDPYDYSSSLIMEVDDSITDWSSNNSLQVSYTTGESMTETNGESTNTVTTTHFGYTDTTTTTTGASIVKTNVNNQTDSYNTSKTMTITEDNTTSWSVGMGIGGDSKFNLFSVALDYLGMTMEGELSGKWGTTSTISEIISTNPDDPDNKDGKNIRTGYTKSKNETTVETGPTTTTITNEIKDRVTEATGNTTNSSISLTTNDSTTITKTYDASYFNANGSPLQWKIIKYTVKMPMFYQAEILIDGEWIFGDSNYCTLNTIQGTCRAWLQNNVAYYEHWGTGEPVTWDEFWSQFFTEEKLIAAYKNRLYPDF